MLTIETLQYKHLHSIYCFIFDHKSTGVNSSMGQLRLHHYLHENVTFWVVKVVNFEWLLTYTKASGQLCLDSSKQTPNSSAQFLSEGCVRAVPLPQANGIYKEMVETFQVLRACYWRCWMLMLIQDMINIILFHMLFIYMLNFNTYSYHVLKFNNSRLLDNLVLNIDYNLLNKSAINFVILRLQLSKIKFISVQSDFMLRD